MPPNASIVWLASYPKSGNTWLRFLICNLLFGPQDSAANISRLIPDVHEISRPAELRYSGMLKTHFKFDARMPLVDYTSAAIYVIRHPADVLLSNYFYSQRSIAGAPAAVLDDYVDQFISARGDPRWIALGMGSWEDNVRSWLTVPAQIPVIRIRYEDLRANPHEVGSTLAHMLNPAASRADIARAIEASSFGRMQEIEQADIRERRVGIFYKPYLQGSIDSGRRFMRQGAVGEGAQRLTAEQYRRLIDAFGVLMHELGYSDEPRT